ncbi:hypothetical protein FRC03_003788 [Tulasnella sp. 419]|nr:hypothetical protein FRC03_003788 [Tulasnella sp. 419]
MQKQFSRIWACDARFDDETRMTVAVKEIKPIVPVEFPFINPGLKERTLREFRLLESLDHPNIVKMIECNQLYGMAILINPWCHNGEVRPFIRDRVQRAQRATVASRLLGFLLFLLPLLSLS